MEREKERSIHLLFSNEGAEEEKLDRTERKRVSISMPKSGGGEVFNSARQPLLRASYTRCLSHAGDELKSFRSCLRWLCVDQSDTPRAVVSWFLFLFLGLFVPAASHLLLIYSPARRPYNLAVQLSLTAVSSLSYLCLSAFHRRYGLRRFLFLDKLVGESERVRLGYTIQLSRSFRLLAFFVMPCFGGDAAYKIWWYATGAGRVPDYLILFGGRGISWASDAAACGLELASWMYRMAIFFLVCVLFRLICYLQILRLQDFAAVFREESDVATVLREHLRIRRQLRIISHRYRAFIVSCLLLVTASNFASLLLTTGRHHAEVNIVNAGELALCSVGLMTGLLICLRSAAKITHKAQAITSHAATWHVFATIESSSADTEDPLSHTSAAVHPSSNSGGDSDDEEARDELELDDTKLMPSHVNTISFQKRQALVTYLENNRAGITVFGFVVDRSSLQGLFMIEFSLVLWLLGKTIGIS
ncbi:uncharacterized protein LOC103706529 [Phoenix dactylifera]|uniref:Uncharacterized protein LOC103706529 n=1 Tax=Phoenix dactylifera TaxID=42345 RepID=A0A8B7C052_PHODC|nr:uncharacterized protein LOC103706529 [Phoenix dactylifera]